MRKIEKLQEEFKGVGGERSWDMEVNCLYCLNLVLLFLFKIKNTKVLLGCREGGGLYICWGDNIGGEKWVGVIEIKMRLV